MEWHQVLAYKTLSTSGDIFIFGFQSPFTQNPPWSIFTYIPVALGGGWLQHV